MLLASDPFDVEPLAKTESLRDRIYGDLLGRLQRGEIDHQTRLVDTEIAALFGTSRMPAREALLQLTTEGYLVGTSRGFRVPRLTDQDIRDIFELRKLLEPRAAGQAAGLIGPKGLAAMHAALAQARNAATACDLLEMIAANTAFRQAWLDAVPNTRMSATIKRFADHVQVVRLETLKSAETQRYVAAGLAEILALFEACDGEGVSARMATFIGVAEESYFALRAAQRKAQP